MPPKDPHLRAIRHVAEGFNMLFAAMHLSSRETILFGETQHAAEKIADGDRNVYNGTNETELPPDEEEHGRDTGTDNPE